MTGWVNAAFLLVYLGLILGGIPGLRIDRTGIALLGAILLLASGAMTEQEALLSIDLPTLALLFGLMVLAAQFQLGGFYAAATRRLGRIKDKPRLLLAVIIAFTGLLSSLLSNDVVCVAVAPPLLALCGQHRLNPIPYLLGLACAANIGSAATLIGNPQNILIGQSLDISFTKYLAVAAVPSLLGLALTWALLAWQYRGQWEGPAAEFGTGDPPFDLWQTLKGVAVLLVVVVVFVAGSWPRELVALAGGAFLFLSRKFHSRQILGLIDWSLLLLFVCLFMVNAAFQSTGQAAAAVAGLKESGIDLANPGVLFVVTPILSNVVSNVPAVMLLLPSVPSAEMGMLMALASTLAGNFIIVGSVANIIVVENARRAGITINFWTHARTGIPLTLASLALAAIWLWLVLY